MKAVFAHDHIFLRNSAGIYLSEKLPYTLWKSRYLTMFDIIDIVARSEWTGPSGTAGRAPAVGPGVQVFPVPSLSSPMGRIFNRAEAHRVLHERIKSADCVIVRLPSEIGEAAAAVARKIGKPTAVEMVACAWDSLWTYGTWQGKVYAPISYCSTRAVVGRASHVIYVTEHFLQRRYPTKGCTAAVSDVVIDPPSPSFLEDRLEKKREKQEGLKIGMIGNLLPYKGIDTLLKAGFYLKRRGVADFRLCFLGGGDPDPWKALAARLEVAQLCEFHGVLPAGPSVWKWLDDIDIYVQPSLMEGLPRATVEAMSRGCPVIGSTVGGLPELLPPENLHKPRDVHRLADLIERMLIDSSWRRECSRATFSKALEYSPKILDQRRQAFWRHFIGGVRTSK
jgi:glycosyltransferase involved in cell wall biosynthesis